MTILFEAFLVYYLLQCLVLVLAAFYLTHEPKESKKKKVYDPWGFWQQ